MSNLYVTHNGEQLRIDPDMFVLLYMPNEQAKRVQQFINEHNLQNKFDVVNATISVHWEEDEKDPTDSSEPIKSLCLKMCNEKVLFEYKLSGRVDKLLTDITNYVNGSEEEN